MSVEIKPEYVEAIKKEAESCGISKEELSKLQANIEKEQRDLGVPEDRLSDRVPRRMFAYMKKQKKSSANFEDKLTPVDSLWIFGRTHAIDRAKKHLNISKDYLDKFGMEHAVKDGYYNEKGEALYKKDQYKKGVIPEHDWEADGYGLMVLDGETKFTSFRFKGEAAIKPLTYFKRSEAKVFLRKSRSENDFAVTLNNLPKVVSDEYLDFKEVIPLIKEAAPGNVLTTLKDLSDFHREAQKNRTWNPWCLVTGDVVNIAVLDDSWVVNVDDVALRAEHVDEGVGIFFNKDMEIDLTEEACQAYFFVSPYERKNGKGMGLSGLGYWVEDYDRAKREQVNETPDVQDAWG